MSLIVKPNHSISLPDLGCWKNRFEVRSETSNRIYIVAQHKETGEWGCSCPGYCRHRKCKHLIDGCGLSENEIFGNKKISNKKREKING
jgi:hypothetical protein